MLRHAESFYNEASEKYRGLLDILGKKRTLNIATVTTMNLVNRDKLRISRD